MLVIRIDNQLEVQRKPTTPRKQAKMYYVFDAGLKKNVFGPETLDACQSWRKAEVKKRNLKNFISGK